MATVEIKIILLKKGLKQIDLARKFGVTPGMIHGLIAGKFESKRLKRELVNTLGIPYEELWGEDEGKAA